MGNLFSADDYVPMEIRKENNIYMYHHSQHTQQIVGIVINVSSGTSYDPLFTKVPQKSASGTRVIVYHCNYENLELFSQEMRGIKSKKPVIGRILEEIKTIDADCTIFNWQCCSCLENITFPNSPDFNMRTLRLILDKGHMAMFSDFSLKVLIKYWDASILGPNPFIFLRQFGGNFKLGFNRKAINNCPSSQLQTIANLSKESNCELKALEKTVVYTINPQALNNPVYTIQVLTVALVDGVQAPYQCRIDEYVGSAGHVLLKFKSGGSLLASMGHWCQLLKIKTSEEQLMQVVKQNYGEQRFKTIQSSLRNLSGQAKFDFIETNAMQMVQQSTPGNNHYQKRNRKLL